MLGTILNTLSRIAEEILKKQSLKIALEDEWEINIQKFESFWDWANRKPIHIDYEKNRVHEVSPDEEKVIDAVIPTYSQHIWQNNSFIIALYFSKEEFKQISRFYQSLLLLSEKYSHLKLMADSEKYEYDENLAFTIWKEIKNYRQEIDSFKQKKIRLITASTRT